MSSPFILHSIYSFTYACEQSKHSTEKCSASTRLLRFAMVVRDNNNNGTYSSMCIRGTKQRQRIELHEIMVLLLY